MISLSVDRDMILYLNLYRDNIFGKCGTILPSNNTGQRNYVEQSQWMCSSLFDFLKTYFFPGIFCHKEVFVQCCTVLYCTVLYCTVLYCTVLYCTVLYCTVLYCTVLYCTVLYCTVLYCRYSNWTVTYSTSIARNKTEGAVGYFAQILLINNFSIP